MNRPVFAAAAALILGLLPCALAPPGLASRALAQDDPNATLPPGPGRAETIRACTGCHDATTLSGQPRTPEAWDRVIGDMMTNGADLSGDEHALVYAYLAKNFAVKPAEPPAPEAAKPPPSR